MNIIAFGHRMRVGKDTATKFALNYLRGHTPLKCARYSFGDRIKQIAYEIYKGTGLEDSLYYENNPKLKDSILPAVGKSPRQIWVELGLKGREIWPYTWTEMTFSQMGGDVAIISDLRDPSEVEYVQKFGGKLVKIERSDQVQVADGIDEKLETFREWDFVIYNNTDLRDFNKHVVNVVKQSLRAWGLG